MREPIIVAGTETYQGVQQDGGGRATICNIWQGYGSHQSISVPLEIGERSSWNPRSWHKNCSPMRRIYSLWQNRGSGCVCCEPDNRTAVHLSRPERIKNSERQQILLQFCKIHGVGPSTARELYERYKCRTIEDVEQHAHVLPSMGEKSTMCMN